VPVTAQRLSGALNGLCRVGPGCVACVSEESPQAIPPPIRDIIPAAYRKGQAAERSEHVQGDVQGG
jgi:hypothetical protein